MLNFVKYVFAYFKKPTVVKIVNRKADTTTIDIIVRDAVNRQIAVGVFDKNFGAAYGVSRQGMPR